MCDKMAISVIFLKGVEKDLFSKPQFRVKKTFS